MNSADDGSGGAGAGAGEGAAGAGAAGAGAGGDGGGQAAAYYESFTDEALKTNPAVQRYKTAEELAAGFVNLEKRFGIDPARRIDLPADPNDEAAMKAVYAKLGMPEKPDGYGFNLDDKASDTDKSVATAFTETAHKLGLSVNQAKGLMEFMQAQVTTTNEANATALVERAAAGKATLEKEFGQAFDPRLKEIRGLVEKYGDPELAEAVKGENIYGFPNLAKFLGKLVERMAEPGAAGGNAGDADTGTRPMTPAQAKAAVQVLEGDAVKGKALHDKAHPQHEAVVKERSRLLALADGRQPA